MFRSSVLSIPAFRNLWLGQAISQLGDAFYYVSFMYMVKQITGSAAMVGFVGAAEMLPFLIFGPYAGVLADRIDRRKIMLLSDLLSGGTLLLLAGLVWLAPNPPVEALFVTAFMLSTVRAFFMPAKNAAIPAVVPREQVIKANTLSMATQNFMPMIGLAFSASVLGLLFKVSPTWFFLSVIVINAFSFFGSAVFVARMPAVVPDRTEAKESRPMADLVEGLRYIGSRSVLVALLALGLFLSLIISPFFVVYVSANDQWFGGLPQTLSWFEFGFFAGMISGCALVGWMNVKRPGLGYIWGLAIVGVAVALMAYSRTVPLFFAWNVVAGLALPFAQIPVSSYIQMTVPDALRGRVNGALTMTSMGVQPVGMALGGLLVQSAGLVNTFLIMGCGMAVVAGVGLMHGPFRRSHMDDGAPRQEPTELQEATAGGYA